MPHRANAAALLPAVALALLLGAPSALPAGGPAAGPVSVGTVGVGTVVPPGSADADPGGAPGVRARPSGVRAPYVPPAAGAVAHPFDPPAHRWESGHRGVDVWSDLGAVVVAPGAGVVTFAGSVGGKPVVVVTHADGLRSSLEPVTATVARGTAVRAGDPIGVLVAAPGTAASPDHCADLTRPSPTAACVHWGVRRGENYVDPLTLLGLAAPIVLLPPLSD